MNRKKIILFLGLSLVFLTSGCQQEIKRAIPGEFQSVVFHSQREKVFGIYEDDKLSKEAAIKLLKEKYALEPAPLISQYEELAEKIFVTDDILAQEPLYTLAANNERLLIEGQYYFKHEETLIGSAFIYTEYIFDAASEQVTLADQSLTINKSETLATFPALSAVEIVDHLGEILQVKERQKVVLEFEKNYPEITNPEWLITDNVETAFQQKAIRSAIYANVKAGNIYAIYGRLVDYTNQQFLTEDQKESS